MPNNLEKPYTSEALAQIYANCVDNSAHVIIVVDTKGKIIIFNNNAELMFGYARMEVIGQEIEILMPELFRTRHASLRESYMISPQTREMGKGLILFAQHRSGHRISVEIQLSPIYVLDYGVHVQAIIQKIRIASLTMIPDALIRLTAEDVEGYDYPVLFIDDEIEILKSLYDLYRLKYKVFTAQSGAQALDIIKNGPLDPFVVVSDQRMPNQTGVEFFQEVRELIPKAVRIICTGYSDISAVISSINVGQIRKFIMKPFDAETFSEIMRDAVAYSLLTRRHNPE